MTHSHEELASAGTAAPRPQAPVGLPTTGRWRLLQRIGEGAMADVYLAAPRENAANSAASYAVKVLKPRWEDEPAAVALLAREAFVAQAVSHPHLPAVLDWSLERAPYFIVTPRLNGATLEHLLLQDQLPTLPVALWIARQAAQALEALHAAGWMHADVKPSNLFVSPEGHVTLIDLGYARCADEPASAAERLVQGTLSHMAPEMLTSTRAADIRSDLYSLGVVLYEMLTGRLPYEGRNPVEAAAMQREGVPDRLRCLAPHLPPAVVTLVRQLLAKEPLRRPQTPGELIRRLVPLEIATLPERLPA